MGVGGSNQKNSSEAVDGVVLDRRARYLEICIKASDAINLEANTGKVYRLDCLVNRVSYDRMLLALQVFTQSASSNGTVSKLVKDLLLYSYPNSLIRLHLSPGGLRLALPQISGSLVPDRNILSPAAAIDGMMTASETEENDPRVALKSTGGSVQPNPPVEVRGESAILTVAAVLQSPTVPLEDVTEKQRVLNIRKALSKLSRQNPSQYQMTDSILSSTDLDDKSFKPIFIMNERLQEMVKSRTLSATAKSSSLWMFSHDEIKRALTAVSGALIQRNLKALNPSQSEAVYQAISRPLSLIQGPPGTGKVSDHFLEEFHISRPNLLLLRRKPLAR